MSTTLNNTRTVIISIIAIILSIPLIAMQFTNEVNWSILDFAVAGILLSTIGFAIDLTLNHFQTNKTKIIIIAGILFLGVIIWAELAVGIFGSPFAGS